MADPTRPRTGPRGPHADGGASLARITTYCGEGLPGRANDSATTPHVVTGHNNFLWGRKNPQRRHNVLHVENASPPASPIFLSTRGKVRARGQHPSLRRDRTLPSHRRGFWPPHSTILHYGQSPQNSPTIVPPLLRVAESMSEVRDETAPNCTERPELAPNDRSSRLSPIALIFHGSLPIGIDGVGKRELASNSTKWRRRWTQSTSRTLNPGLIQSDRRLSRMRWASDWPRASGGDFRPYIARASPLVISDTVLRRRSTWPPIVSRRPSTRSVGASPPRLSTRGAKRLPLLRNARLWDHSLCGGQIVLSIECTLAIMV